MVYADCVFPFRGIDYPKCIFDLSSLTPLDLTRAFLLSLQLQCVALLENLRHEVLRPLRFVNTIRSGANVVARLHQAIWEVQDGLDGANWLPDRLVLSNLEER